MPTPVPESALLTGATGFVGAHLAARLKREGCDTHVIIRPHSQAAFLKQLLGSDHVHIHDGATEGLLAIVDRAKPRAIFHLASLFLAQHHTPDVAPLIHSNVEFSTQLAEAAAVHKVPHFINTGTAWQHYDDEPFNPVNLYAATKQAFASILRYYTASCAFRSITLELFDTYGPGDARPKLFSALRKAARTGENLAMSSGEQLIDLVFIDDVVDAYLAAAARIQAGGALDETFAVSSSAPLPLRTIVERWSLVTGRPLKVQWGARPHRPREIMRPWSQGSTLPGWRPQTSLEEGIQKMEHSFLGVGQNG